MPHAVLLRSWQHAALDRFIASEARDFLAVATPGSGKTRFALAAALHDLATSDRSRVLVVAPTHHLKVQWARAAADFGLHLDPAWSARDGGRIPRDMHGAVLTYQQVASNADAVRRLAATAFVVFDEVHHAGDDRAWGSSVREAFEPAGRRLALSGTPFRSDTSAIPFVRYEHGLARPDHEYGYGAALADGVVRPIYFPRIDGQMEWTAPDGGLRSSTFADELDAAAANQRLRTALSLDGEWLPSVLADAYERLHAVRRDHADAGGLVIAMDQEHARGIAALLRARHNVAVVVATSDDPTASARIARYAADDTPWLVTVRMVSEGVDIPRLRVGVFATNTTTELFFRQAVGRLVRATPAPAVQPAYLCIPDDPRLRTWSARLAEHRRHSLRRPTDDDRERTLRDAPAPRAGEREQLSLFAALSAVVVGTPDIAAPPLAPPAPPNPPDGVVVTLAPPPPLTTTPADDGGTSRHERKEALRAANADRARTLALLTGRPHREVNAELNRRVGLRTIRDATLEDLQRRLEHADRWLRAV